MMVMASPSFAWQSHSFKPVSGQIKGKVSEKSTRRPLERVSVALFRLVDSTMVSGTMTDEKGIFVLKDINPGDYYIRGVLVGYQKVFFGPIKVNFVADEVVNIGNVEMVSVAKTLNEVAIAANKGYDASQVDKKVYSPNQLMSAVAGSAMDVLNNIPSVNLNSEGQMSFRGNENLTIFIDGKPSSLTNASLQQIPAQAIENIEVISNPSAKFNPEGTAGIINIVMKKNRSKLNSGSIIIGAGTNNKYNAAASYNYQYKKVNLYLNYGYRNEERWNNGFSNRFFQTNEGRQNFYQNQEGNKFDVNHFFRSNLEYEITKNMSVTIGGNLTLGYKNDYNTKTNTNRDVNGVLKEEWNRKIWENNQSLAYDVNVVLKREYSSPRHYLNIDFIQNYNRNEINNPIEENYYQTIYVETYINTPFEIYNWQGRMTNNIKVDYAKPLGEKYYVELGLNSQWRDFNFVTNSKKWNGLKNELQLDSAYSNDFRFLDDIYGVYGTLAGKYGDLSIKAGLRLEQANTRSDNYNVGNYYRFNYFVAFPSMALNYDLPKNQKVSASYSRRINRPGPGQLNAVQDITDPTSLRLGNPMMRPEFINSFELGYVKSFMPQFAFNTNVYYKHSVDAMTRFVTIDTLGRSVVQVQNLGNNTNAGWEAVFNYNPVKWFSSMLSSNVFINQLTYQSGTREYTNGNWVWNGRLNATFKLPKEIDLQLVAFYRSASKTPQGTFNYQSSVDLTVRKKVLKQRGLITIGVQDIFNTLRFNIRASDTNFEAELLRKTESRIGNISFKYNFGSEDKKPKTKLPEPKPMQQGEGEGAF